MRAYLAIALILTACGGGEPNPLCAEPDGPPSLAAGNLSPAEVQAIWDRWKLECKS